MIIAVAAIAILAVTFFSESSRPEGWFSFEDGKKLSEEQGKEMFVFIGTPTCPVCREFKEFFSTNKTAMELIRAQYIPVYVDASREKPPVRVTFVPLFCKGFYENLSCFSSSDPKELMRKIGVWE